MEMEEHARALPHFSKALECYEKAVTDTPGDLTSRFMIVTSHTGVARIQARLGEIDPALEEIAKRSPSFRTLAEASQAISGELKRAVTLAMLISR